MLILHGTNPVIEDILKIKGIQYTHIKTGSTLALETQELLIEGSDLIIQYLDERYPIPQLISGDVNNRIRIKQLALMLAQKPQIWGQAVAKANPFILGEQLTLLDILAANHSGDKSYNQFIKQVINGK
jgi:hypothetical protein